MSDAIMQFLTGVIVPLAWPLVVVAGVWAFKSEIREVMTRIVKAGPTGLEMTPQSSGLSGGALRGEVEELQDDNDEAVTTEAWGDLEPWLNSLEQNLEQRRKSDDVTEIKRIAAANDRRAVAQFLLRTIYGTQYEALVRMLETPRPLSDFDDLFKEHRREVGEAAYTTPEGWLGWLTQNNFARISGGMYQTSDLGKSLIDFISFHGQSGRGNYG